MKTSSSQSLDSSPLELLPLTKKYLDLLRRLRNDPRITRHLYSSPHISKKDQRKYFRQYIRNLKTQIFVIFQDKPLGFIHVDDIDCFNQSCEIGLYIAPKYQNKGYGTRAVKLLVHYIFQELKLHKIYLGVFPDNHRAIKLYRKCGFKKEGFSPDKVFKNRKFRDVIIMSIIRKTAKK